MNVRSDDERPNDGQFGESAGRHGRPGEEEFVGFAAVRVDGGGSGSEEWVAPEDILFAFTRGAIPASAEGVRKPAIWAPWTPKFALAHATVYLRTPRGLYRSYVRTLAEFKRKVSAARFGVVSKSVVANLPRVHSPNLLRQRPATLSYQVDKSEIDWPHEFVVVSRDYLPSIRDRFGMPPRAQSNS